ncbi:MAG: sugar transferase [Candidatus Moraniibacteriota bacterium]
MKVRRKKRNQTVVRVHDFKIALGILILLSPVLLGISIAILISMGWPIIFSQSRIGKNGKRFKMYKFRSMYNGCGVIPNDLAIEADPRITLLGRFLRRHNLDELPQFFNVLKGDMALVGPRPEMDFQPRIDRFRPEDWKWRIESGVDVGVTGVWQLRYKKILPLYHPRIIKIERIYARYATHGSDLKIIFLTFYMRVIKTNGHIRSKRISKPSGEIASELVKDNIL